MLNPALANDIAEILHLAVNAISLILLVPLGVAVAYTLVKTIGIVLENQKGLGHA